MSALTLESRKDRQGQSPPVPVKGLRIPPPILMLLCAAAMWALAHLWPLWRIVAAPWNQCGWWLMDISAIAPILAFFQFRRAGTTLNPLSPGAATELVTWGVYAWTRNPMYLSLVVLLCGWAISLGTLSALLGPIFFVPVIRYFQIDREERALRLLFEGQYEHYCRNVGRWFGRRSG